MKFLNRKLIYFKEKFQLARWFYETYEWEYIGLNTNFRLEQTRWMLNAWTVIETPWVVIIRRSSSNHTSTEIGREEE
jgi:hypothetical protein